MQFLDNKFETSRLGVAITTSSGLDNYFTMILDANNVLWYADNKDQNNYISSFHERFQLVLFKIGENHKAFEVRPLPSGYDKYKFSTEWKIEKRDESFFPFISGIYPNCPFISSIGTGWYGSASLHIIKFLLEKDSVEAVSTKYFIVEFNYKAIRELNDNEITLLNCWLERPNPFESPIDANAIQDICKTVKDFNPYEVFESYSICIEHRTLTNVGKDDDEYDCKCYSIKYYDKYLSRWFNNCEYDLSIEDYRPFCDTPFAPVNFTKHPNKRFYDEEEHAKKKAYAEYNKMEHFDCLIKEYYNTLKKHFEERENDLFNYPRYFWLPTNLSIDKVFYWLANYAKTSIYCSEKKELIEKTLISDMDSFYSLVNSDLTFDYNTTKEERERECLSF